MPTISHTSEVDFECHCDECGKRLDANVTRKGNEVAIRPCEACIEAAKEEARNERE